MQALTTKEIEQVSGGALSNIECFTVGLALIGAHKMITTSNPVEFIMCSLAIVGVTELLGPGHGYPKTTVNVHLKQNSFWW